MLKLLLSMYIAYLVEGVAVRLANSIVCKSNGILASSPFLLFDDRLSLNESASPMDFCCP